MIKAIQPSPSVLSFRALRDATTGPSADHSHTLPPTTPPGVEKERQVQPNSSEDGKPLVAAPIVILGVPFDNVTTAQTVSLIEDMVESREPHQLVTANVDFLVQSLHDVELHRILTDAHMVLCDGMPLVWASRLLGNPLPERVAGSDLVPLLIETAVRKQYRIFFLGGSPEIAAQAVANLKQKHPQVVIAGHFSPPVANLFEMDHVEICRQIREAKPDLLFVSFGCPKQEKWIAMHYRDLGVPVSVGVGATIDFLAGKVLRAPRWMRGTGTEWLFRLAQEPRRLFKRYMRGLWIFTWAILLQWWRMQLRGVTSRSTPRINPVKNKKQWQHIVFPKRVDADAVRQYSLLCANALASSQTCLLDLQRVRFIDSTGMGLLVRLQRHARIAGRKIILLAPSSAVRSALRLMKVDKFFTIANDQACAQQMINGNRFDGPVLVRPNYYPWKPSIFWQGEITSRNVDEVWKSTSSEFLQRST
ncbi:MAG: Anti-sigma-factor antagonist and glycosyl transferase, partial [Verrucomicrobiales bacterium]|nr:Anti-sigma-factor antagonist and glycosyl transferase [Verrucomicrobiales bacterium]